MKFAAIYARMSTGQTSISNNLNRQIDCAMAYAAEKGWAVAEEHIYVDDGAAGVNSERRPGFVRLMSALKPRPPFRVLLVAEVTRLGRSVTQLTHTLEQLDHAGVRVCCYREDRERPMDVSTRSR